MEVRRSALVAHPAERLFALIEAAEHYPAFLPWCASATILERSESLVSARIEVAWLGARFGFVTRNPKRAPTWMAIGLADGPFRRFEGEWNLTPLGDAGCRVEFRLAYDFAAGVVGTLAAPVFDRAANTLMDAFVRRADAVAAGHVRIELATASARPATAPAAIAPAAIAPSETAPSETAPSEIAPPAIAPPAPVAADPLVAPAPPAPALTPVSAAPTADSNIGAVADATPVAPAAPPESAP